MPDRWPPMIGVVGFDGGHRPAVALAIPPGELTSDEGEQEGGGPGDETGACCNPDGSCDDGVTQFDCTSSGGIFQGFGTDCDSVTCEAFGACCVDTDCTIETESDCTDMGGTYQGDGTTCDPNPCGGVATGACCVDITECTVETPDDCDLLGGTYRGDGTVCSSGDLCPCCCGLNSPFTDGMGGYFTTVTSHCDGPDTYSGPTTADAVYSHYEEHFTCCDPGVGHLDITEDDFCMAGTPPFCDNTFDCDPIDCTLDCVGGSVFEGTQTVSNLVSPPYCTGTGLDCIDC